MAVIDDGGTGGAIFVSVDGMNWVQASIGTPYSLNAAAYGGNQYIAVGGSSTIVGSQLAAVEGPTYDLSSASFSFTVSGPPGNYGVWVSPSFTGPYTWLPPNIMFTSSGSGSSQTVKDLESCFWKE